MNKEVNSFEEIEDDPLLEGLLTKMAPIILKYVRAKVKLFVKHIVVPNFSNYDLRLEIADHNLNVQIHGYYHEYVHLFTPSVVCFWNGHTKC